MISSLDNGGGINLQMIRSRRILFITNRNIINTCGELRLIKNRAEVLFHQYNYRTDFLVLTHKVSLKSEDIDAGGTIEICKYSIRNLISFIQRNKRFERMIRDQFEKNDYDVVIISGADILPQVDFVRNLSEECILIADCHGAYEELIEFDTANKVKNIARHRLYKTWKNNEKKYLPLFDHIMAVSEGLKSYLIKEYRVQEEKIHVIPCAIKFENINMERLLRLRENAREKYGIGTDIILFIYSGGTSKWQCIDETVTIFKEIHDILPNTMMLLLSGDIEYISKYKGNGIVVDSLKSDEVNAILPAGDFAFLLRNNNVTNIVAYPNKFLEYVVAGLKIISTPYVSDIADAIQKYKMGYVLPGVTFDSNIIDYIVKSKHAFGTDIDKRNILLGDASFERRLNFFVSL